MNPDQSGRSANGMRVAASQCERAGWRNAAGPARLFTLLLLTIAALSLPGCMAHLAPDYDQGIVDGLTAANKRTMVLFASVSSGATPPSFPTREPTYNSIIGQFDALRLEITARPMPQLPSLLAPADHGKTSDAASTAPSAGSLKTVVQTLTRMRNKDQSGPMPAEVVALFKNNYELSFRQALTYENALKR